MLFSFLCQTLVEGSCYRFLVKMLADKDELLHAIAVFCIPIALKVGILSHELLQLTFRHGGVPLPCIADVNLFSCLLEYVAGVALVLKIADTLGTDNALRPFAGHELVE